jgi:DNA mismatch repair protein MutS
VAELTPMMKQYQKIKENHKDAILFFRLGDFYEMFLEDAKIASRELEITLTSRDGGNNTKIPMCGIPYHAADGYLAKLINKGYRVAICEQVEDPKAAKGIVKREVVRIITPGTVLESNILHESKQNYLISIYSQESKYALTYTDISRIIGFQSISKTIPSLIVKGYHDLSAVSIICSSSTAACPS